jgi:hypothetical protein
MSCSDCGSPLNDGSALRPLCGAGVAPAADKMAADVSPKSRLATSLLAWFLGEFGVHRFYLGKTSTAVIMLAMGLLSGIFWFGGFFGVLNAGGGDSVWVLLVIGVLLYFGVSVWKIIDFIVAVTGNSTDGRGKPVKKW